MFGIVFVGQGVFSGAFMTGASSLAPRLFPHEKFAQFASAAGLITGLCAVSVPPLVGAILDATGHIYRHTSLMAALMSVVCLLVLLEVNRRFVKFGGRLHYQPPG